MSWWNDAKKALGVAAGTPEERDGHARAAELLADEAMLALTRRAVARFEDADDAETIRILARPGSGDVPPRDGPARRNWIRMQVEASFRHPDASARYDTTGPLDEMLDATMRTPGWIAAFLEDNVHEAAEDLALTMASRYAAMHAPAMEAMRRMEAEIAELRIALPDVIADRFSQIPPARIDPCPSDMALKTRWLRDMLIGEHAIVRAGAVPPERVLAAARRIGVDVPIRPIDADGPQRIDGGAYHPDNAPWGRLQAQADHLANQDDAALARRFGAIPGVAVRIVQPPSEPNRRTAWIRRALGAELVRRTAGLEHDDAQREMAGGLSIEIEDVSIGALTETSLSFDASLIVDGARICDVASTPTGGIEALNWAEGCDDGDLAALEAYISATGRPRVGEDGRERPDTLAARIYDRIAVHAATAAYRIAAERAVLFIADPAADEMVLMRVDVPEGGTKEGAREHIASIHPDAVFLEDLAEEDAVEAWSALA